MSIEFWILLAAAFWGLVHLSASSFAFKAQEGNAYTVGPRDEERPRQRLAGRLHRAQWNFLETFPIFAALVLMLEVLGAANNLSQWGSGLYLAGRIFYLPLYAAGIPWLRTFSWNLATLGLVLTGIPVLQLGF